MKMRTLLHDSKLITLSAGVSAGTDGAMVTSLPEVDTEGFSSCTFIVRFGTATASSVTTLRVKNYTTTATPGSGTVNQIGSDMSLAVPNNTYAVIEVHKPQRRFLALWYQRTVANQVISYALAILHNKWDKQVEEDLDDNAATNLWGWDVMVEPEPSAT